MAASFQRRRLDLTIKLAAGTFDDQGGADTVALTGLRVEADIDAPGGADLKTARLRIFGLSQSLMNRLTVLAWQAMSFQRNTIRVDAGTGDGQDLSTIFFGDIYNAMADYQGAPDVPFLIEAQSGFVDKLAIAAAQSYPGAQSVATIFQKLASGLGATLENNGVTGTVTDMYLPGTLMDKVRTLARAAQVDFYYEPPVLAICPQGTPRQGDIVVINPQSGLVGWPTVDKVGVAFTSLYNPSIRHGGKVKVESSVKPANGEWYVYSLSHRLESEKPGGAWFTHVQATEQANAVRL